MTSEGSTFKNLSPINSAAGDFAKELEDDLLQSQSHDESATSEARGNLKRKWPPVSNTKGKPKSTKKGRSTLYVGESSSQPKEEVLDTKRSVPELIRILRLRLERRIEKYKIADMLCGFWLMCNLVNSTIFKVYKPIITDSLDQMKKQWPVRTELKNIKKNIKGIEDDHKAASSSKMKRKGKMKKQAAGLANKEVLTDDQIKQKLVQIAEEMERTDTQLQEDSKKAEQLQEFFTTEDVSVEIQREKLSSAFPWLFFEDQIATNGPTVGQDEPSLQSREQLVVKDNFERLFVRDDNNVKVANFQGLKEAIENTTGWNVPAYLEPIASKIKMERGKETELEFLFIQVLVCAAIKEMEEVPIVKLEYPTLLKWGNTLKKAEDDGFKVRFAEDLLEHILAAFLAYRG